MPKSSKDVVLDADGNTDWHALYMSVLKMCHKRWGYADGSISAEDIAQNIMLETLTHEPRPVAEGAFYFAWSILSFRVVDAARLVARTRKRETAIDFLEDTAATSDNVQQLLDRDELDEPLSQLTEHQRYAVVMCHGLGFDARTAGECVGRSKVAINMAGMRARKVMREALGVAS